MTDKYFVDTNIRAARASGAEVLYSEDLSDSQIHGTVRVVNPLRS